MRQALVVSSLWLALGLSPLPAQEPPPAASSEPANELSQLSLEQLLALDLSTSAKVERTAAESPGLTTLVTADQIRDYGWISLDDILGLQPGFEPAQDYDRPTVGFRGQFEGWNNNHLLLLVDGIPMNDDLYGTAYTWEITPLTLARDVEIVRGPGSALYGSNAINGTLEIDTVRPEDLPHEGRLAARTGSDGMRIYDAIVGQSGKLASAVVAYSSFETDGNDVLSYDGSGRTDAQGNPAKFETRDGRNDHYFWAKVDGKGALSGLSLQLHDQYWQFHTGHGWLWWIPDQEESMREGRQLVAASYKLGQGSRLHQEYALRYQRHDIEWNQRYYPDDAFGGYYPAGMWEFLETSARDLFGRAQVSYDLAKGASVLAGLESSRFRYDGDVAHTSNVNVDDPAFPPFPDNRMEPLGPWLDFIKGEPITNVAGYTQYASGKQLGEHLELTAGLRYDSESFDFHRIYDPGRPQASKSFSKLSPRLALVSTVRPDLTFKLLAGRAFRTPSPTELAGAHTFSLASNIDQLKPETLTSYEAAMDWRLFPQLDWRVNVFHSKFDNQIAYSAQNNNLSTNLYSLTTAGLESELLWSWRDLSGFANFSYARRLDEKILDATIAASPNDLTWSPSHKLNLGVDWHHGAWQGAVSAHYNGTVERRASDRGVEELPFGVGVAFDMDQFRGPNVGSWWRADASASRQLGERLTLGVAVRNLFDERYSLVKVGGFPFDYQQLGRETSVFARVAI